MRLTHSTVPTDIRWFLQQAKPRRVRPMRQFAEDEIVIPSGPFAGTRFRCSRQPFTGLWFDQVDSGRFSRFVGTGPTQSGKTVACFVIPIVYHLFENNETVLCGLPDMDMAQDKWREDLFPIIERSRYKDLLPAKGSGSRGGLVQSIQFRNGATLKFMSGGGGDKSRAGFTSRVVVITETDGMDEPGRTSRESDKISQLVARTRAYGSRARIYMECTVSTEKGRTWQEYLNGSRSRILLPCPHCKQWVGPERDHLLGWHDAASQLEAKSQSKFHCPACGEAWTDAQRTQANLSGRVVHGDQAIESGGAVVGFAPQTETLGFRWSAVNNLLLSSGEIGADEWRASRSIDEENAEKEMMQFVWCIPVAPSKQVDTAIEVHEIATRTIPLARGIVPEKASFLTAAIDLGKYLDHWLVIAWSEGGLAHIVDYGRIEVATDDLGVEKATIIALREFRELAQRGYPVGSADGKPMPIRLSFVDAGYLIDTVYTFCRESGNRFLASVGRGASQQRQQWYNRPTQTGSIVKHIGEGFHINWVPSANQHLVEVDSDHWKTWAHQRFQSPPGAPGSLSLFEAAPQEHLAFGKHVTAEVKTEEFITGRGLVTKWERRRKQNHWLDALYNACAAGSYCGVRLVEEVKKPNPPSPKRQQTEPLLRSDGRPWIDVEGWREVQRRVWRRG